MAQLPDWWDRVDQIFRKAGVPTRVWAAIAYQESTFRSWASNLKPPDNSWGLFQLNRNGGQGAGYSSVYLSDPINNAMIAVKYIAPAVQKCGPQSIACIAVNSGHPGPVPTSDSRVQDIARWYNSIANMDSQEIFDHLTSGHGVPTAPIQTPGLPFDPTNPGAIPGLIGADVGNSIVSAIEDAVHNWIHPPDGTSTIDHIGPFLMGASGVMLIISGVVIAPFYFAAKAGTKVVREFSGEDTGSHGAKVAVAATRFRAVPPV